MVLVVIAENVCKYCLQVVRILKIDKIISRNEIEKLCNKHIKCNSLKGIVVKRIYTEHELEDLAKNNPNLFIELIISEKLNPSSLTFATEILGTINQDKVIPILINLSKYDSNLVREGAVYGLENFIDNKIVFDRLKEMAEEDQSPGVRDSADDVLNNIFIISTTTKRKDF